MNSHIHVPGEPAARAAPVVEDERRPDLDALRGLAIAGVIVANAFTFAYPFFSTLPATSAVWTMAPADQAAQLAVAALVEGKFYTMLCVLLGTGLMLQSLRARRRRAPFVPSALRRLLILLVIGLAHGTLLYAGDILVFYALVAAAALLFRHLESRRLLLAALAALVFGVIAAGTLDSNAGRPDWARMARGEAALPAHIAAALPVLGVEPAEFARFMAAEETVHKSGSWLEVTRYRAYASLLFALPYKLVYLSLLVLGLILLGMYVVQAGLLDRDTLIRRLMWPALILGGLIQMAGLVSRAAAFAGTLLLSAGYASALILLVHNRPRAFAVRALSALGRLALTNYLLVSLLYGLIFYSQGLGLFASMTAMQVLLLTPLALAFHIVFSLWWLNRFRFGPAEWLWRSLTYCSLLPLRREPGV